MEITLKRVLITGASGFIGRRLIQFLLSTGNYEITASGRNLTSKNIFDSNKVTIIDFSIQNISECCKDVDIVIHLAAMDAKSCVKDPISAIDINIKNTKLLLDAAVRNSVDKFIYLSTVHVYGHDLSGKIDEKKIPRPLHPYSITHKSAEDFVIEKLSNNLINGIVIRLSNSYGYNDDMNSSSWDLVINDFCLKAITKKKIVIKSDAYIKRDFISMFNVVRGIEHCIKNDIKGIFNLVSGETTSLIDMAKKIKELIYKETGEYINIYYNEPNSNGVKSYVFSNKKISKTGFTLEKNDSELSDILNKSIEGKRLE